MTVSSELSSSVLMNWECDYPLNKFKPPKDYKLAVVDTDKNWVVERDQLKDCKYLSKLIASFEEVYVWLEVKSVLLIRKQKVGTGFQNWHVDLAQNGETVYTIYVNIGLLDIHADSGDINYIDVNNGAYAPGIDVDDEEAKEPYVGESKCKDDQGCLSVTKKVLQSLRLLHAVWNILMTKPILTPLKVILTTSFGCHFQETVALRISFWVDLKNLT